MSVTAFTGLLYLRGFELIYPFPVASGVVINVGDLVKLSGNTLLDVAAATDDLTFIGVAKESHAATDPAANISVALPTAQAIYNATLDAATSCNPGDLLQLLSGSAIKLKKSTVDPVAMAVQKTTSLTTVDCILMVPASLSAIGLVRTAT